METHTVPVQIRPHLIPFFNQEFQGVDAIYNGRKVKACKINNKSSLGFMLLTALEPAEMAVKPTQYYVYITFDQSEIGAEFYFKYGTNKTEFLMVPEKVNEKINHLLEDIFRMAFVFHCKGMMNSNKELQVQEAISEFMVQYELDEYGFNLDSMRRLLNRGSNETLSRFQNKVANRALNTKNMS